MEKARHTLISDDIPKKFIYLVAGLAALLPEYIGPVLTLACFIVFKRHFSLSGQKVKMGQVGKVFLLFMCYSFISAFWSPTPIYSGAISLLWMGMLLGSFFISNMATTRNRFENLVVCLSVGGGMVGAIALLQYILIFANVKIPNPFWSVLDNVIYNIMPFNIDASSASWANIRASSTFDNPLTCATYLVLVLPIAAYGFTGGKKSNRTVCGICSLFILGGIIATTSRGAALAAIASLLVLVFINSRKVFSVIVTLITVVAGFGVALVYRTFSHSSGFMESSMDSRFKMWEACWELIKGKPLFGYGAGCQSTAIGLKEYGINKPHAHSLYVEMTTELGFVGIIFLAVVFCFIMYDIIKLIKSKGIYKRMGIAFLAVMVSFAIASLTEFTLQTPKELQYFMLILGMLEAAKRLCEKEKEEQQQVLPETVTK